MPARATSMPPVHPSAFGASGSSSTATAPVISVPEASGGSSTAATSVSEAPVPAPTPATLSLPTLQAESPLTLAARAEILPSKASATLQALAELPRIRGVKLRTARSIVWERMVNHEAVLGYTRGKEAPEACTSCKRQSGPFVKCVLVQGKLLGACTNCHYGSGSTRCSFRQDIPGSSVTEPKRISKRIPSHRKTVTKTNRTQWYRKVAKLHRKLAEAYEEEAENLEEVETIEIDDDSDVEMEE